MAAWCGDCSQSAQFAQAGEIQNYAIVTQVWGSSLLLGPTSSKNLPLTNVRFIPLSSRHMPHSNVITVNTKLNGNSVQNVRWVVIYLPF